MSVGCYLCFDLKQNSDFDIELLWGLGGIYEKTCQKISAETILQDTELLGVISSATILTSFSKKSWSFKDSAGLYYCLNMKNSVSGETFSKFLSENMTSHCEVVIGSMLLEVNDLCAEEQKC